ncbi:MAG: TetR/AcrR family transcriptional regulator [Microlunatus sp.]|nr:TetR/AcrR family transcriptional regulator [Microlunatus sp.]MDN5771059.1 TetR/AcrR family transcriptional regulator [Microlunatus sp.]MDN5803730.1 TetR/AcrR family transcriptional regulator [Microlunatus sp.]
MTDAPGSPEDAVRRGDEPSCPELGTEQGRRVLRLLWEPEPESPGPSRGPKPKLTLDAIVAAGTAIADADGVADLSMRKVAARLGVGAMSLYTYLPGRDELIELMVDRAHSELDYPEPDLGWRARVEFLVTERWHLYQRHPWLLDLNMARHPVGPHILDAEEALYAAVASTGLTGSQVVSITDLILWQLLGAARSQISEADEARRTGVSAESYWDSRASFWGTYFSPERFPTTYAIWQAGGFDDEQAHAFDRQLVRLLDGIEASLEPGDL